MNFGKAHKVTTYLAVWCAYLTLLLSSEMSLPATVLSLAGIVGSWWWEAPRVRVERWQKWWSAVGVLVFGWSILQWLGGADLVLAGSELILFLLVAKLFGRRTSRDYLQVYVLSFLMLVAATVVNAEVSFGVFFLAYVVTSTWALILLHLRREIEENLLVRHEGTSTSQPAQVTRILGSRRIVDAGFFAGTGVVSLVVFAGALVLFLAIPRIGFGLFFDKNRGGITLAGFSDGVQLGGHGVIKDDDTVVMRVEVSGPYEGRDAPYLHWRGVAFETYDHGEWRRAKRSALPTKVQWSQKRGTRTTHLRYDDPVQLPEVALTASLDGLVEQDIYLEPLGNDVLFGASMPSAFQVEVGLDRRPRDRDPRNDEWRHHHSAGIKYKVFSRPERPPLAVMQASRERALPPGYGAYLRIPPEVTTRTRELAHQITAGVATPFEKASAIESWLQANLGYTLEMVSPRGQEPIDFFLFDRRKGHCEYFSSAMAILLREVGVPSRDVNGFLGGEWNEYDSYIAVRAGDAHSWVEAYLGDAGWVTFDPTPSGSVDQLGRGGEGFLDRLGRMADTIRFKWFKWVIDYDLESQLAFFDRLGDMFSGGGSGSFKERWARLRAWVTEHRAAAALTLGGVAALVLAIVLWRRRRREPGDAARARRERDPVAAQYLRTLRTLARRGFPRPPATTPREHAAALARSGAPGADALGELTELYYAAEYAGAPSDDAARDRASALASTIEAAFRDAPARPR